MADEVMPDQLPVQPNTPSILAQVRNMQQMLGDMADVMGYVVTRLETLTSALDKHHAFLGDDDATTAAHHSTVLQTVTQLAEQHQAEFASKHEASVGARSMLTEILNDLR